MKSLNRGSQFNSPTSPDLEDLTDLNMSDSSDASDSSDPFARFNLDLLLGAIAEVVGPLALLRTKVKVSCVYNSFILKMDVKFKHFLCDQFESRMQAALDRMSEGADVMVMGWADGPSLTICRFTLEGIEPYDNFAIQTHLSLPLTTSDAMTFGRYYAEKFHEYMILRCEGGKVTLTVSEVLDETHELYPLAEKRGTIGDDTVYVLKGMELKRPVYCKDLIIACDGTK